MDLARGASRPKSSSSNIDVGAGSLPTAIALCCGAGLLAVAIHAWLRLPLHLPGHHGLTAMAVFVMARCIAGRPWAATLAAATSAAIASAPLMVLPPWTPALYLLSGVVLDGVCLLFPLWRERVWGLALAGGLANGAKGLAIVAIGGVHGMAATGLAPVVSHLGFGICGGGIAAALWVAARKRS